MINQEVLTQTLHARLAKIQHDLKAPKGQFNKFGSYSYRKAEDILEAVKPLLDGLMLICRDEIVMVGNRYYVKATYVLSDGTTDIAVWALAREEETKKGMDGSQITGAASSYARKYALNAMFAIDDTKDADGDEKAVDHEKPRSMLDRTNKVLSIVNKDNETSLFTDRCNFNIDKINETKSVAELRDLWKELALDMQNDTGVILAKDIQKCKLENK